MLLIQIRQSQVCGSRVKFKGSKRGSKGTEVYNPNQSGTRSQVATEEREPGLEISCSVIVFLSVLVKQNTN